MQTRIEMEIEEVIEIVRVVCQAEIDYREATKELDKVAIAHKLLFKIVDALMKAYQDAETRETSHSQTPESPRSNGRSKS
jgi:hypothetical protein